MAYWENEKLANAIKENNIDEVKKILLTFDGPCRQIASGTPLGHQPIKTALGYAIELGYKDIVKELILHGYSIYEQMPQ